MFAAVLPDLDMFWFHFVNDCQNLHHDFVFHWPLFWMALASLLLHLALDRVMWLAPFSDQTVSLIEIPARHDWWVWSFMRHWLFAVEIAMAIWPTVRVMKKAPGGALP